MLQGVMCACSLYEAKFVGDVTVPDGSTFKPGVRFTKMWAMLNSGQAMWEGTKVSCNFFIHFSYKHWRLIENIY